MLSHSVAVHPGKEPSQENLAAVYSAFYHAPVPIFVIDRDGTIIDANPVFADKYTRLYSSCIGANLYADMASQPTAPPFSEKRIASVKEVFNTGKFAFVQDIVAGRCLLSGIYPIISPDGKVEKCFIVTQDITEQNELEKRFREQESHWDITSQSCRLGLWKLDLNTMAFDTNAEHDRILGIEQYTVNWSVDSFINSVISEDRPRVKSCIQNSLANSTDEHFECRIRRMTDGAIRWVSIVGKHQFDQDGKPAYVIGVTQDITERKELEIRHAELQEHLQQSQKLELLGQLAGGIAHDFNNVLAAIQGNTDLILQETPTTNPHYENLVSITKSVRRSAEMVRQLLAFARKQPVRPKNIELDVELERMHLILRKLIRENIDLRWQLSCSDAVVNLDPANLVQIVTNIVINARDAILITGCIILQTDLVNANTCKELKRVACSTLVGDFARISISDTGAGIDPQVLPHIFEPFFTTKGIGKGSGLGLSMVYGLVRQNKGYITCRSESDKGTTFEIYFPIVSLPSLTVQKPTAANRSETSDKATVLVVEDEPEIAEIIKIFLEHENYNVLMANTAEEAIAIAGSQLPYIDLVVSDIILPGMNGVNMSKQLLNEKPDMKFLFISGYSADILGQYGTFSEETNFLSKPFALSRFGRVVHDLLAKKSGDL